MTAVVADFGLARVFQPLEFPDGPKGRQKKRFDINTVGCYSYCSPNNRMTVVGSPWWMAPEMLRGTITMVTIYFISL